MARVDLTVALCKSEREGKFFGIVTVPGLPDAHGDVFSPAEVEQMCHRFMCDYALSKADHSPDVEHSGRSADADLLENFVAPQDLMLGGKPVKAGSWVQGWQVHDPVVKREIDEGKLTGLSLEGTGVRRPMEVANA
jgi:hypothetical protein